MTYDSIKSFISEENVIGRGKEVTVYRYHNKVIKIFHLKRLSDFKRISNEGLIKLTELDLKVFNKPIDIIYEEQQIVGYTEKYLEEEDVDVEVIDYEKIKEDLLCLSLQGFYLNDIFYNYIFSGGGVYFTDLTSYQYIHTEVDFLKKHIYKKNLELMNQFLVGLVLFDAFRKGCGYEFSKMYLASAYCQEHCQDIYYGDFLKMGRNR